MTLRALAYLWIYLLGQMWALPALLATVPLPSAAKQRATYRLQGAWSAWNLAALCAVFSLDLQVERQGSVLPGPIILLSRHASLVDTLLPAGLVANPFHIRLRYVLKRELLVDPTLDIGGSRLPNHFIDRSSGESAEIEAIRALGRDLGPDEGVLIYPEGTRYTEAKRVAYTRRMAGDGGIVAETTRRLRGVLPPRPGGTLALLDATSADVVVLAHRGLEGLATVRDIWSGGMVGATISVLLWRVPRVDIPAGRRQRLEWLFLLWERVDQWVAPRRAEAGQAE